MINILFQMFCISHATCWLAHHATTTQNDRFILKLALVGQLIGFMGLCMINCSVWETVGQYCIDCSHYMFVVTLVTGMFMFSELHNQLLMLCMLITTLTTRIYYDRCLFDFASVFYFPDFGVDYNYVFASMILYTAFRVV